MNLRSAVYSLFFVALVGLAAVHAYAVNCTHRGIPCSTWDDDPPIPYPGYCCPQHPGGRGSYRDCTTENKNVTAHPGPRVSVRGSLGHRRGVRRGGVPRAHPRTIVWWGHKYCGAVCPSFAVLAAGSAVSRRKQIHLPSVMKTRLALRLLNLQ